MFLVAQKLYFRADVFENGEDAGIFAILNVKIAKFPENITY